MGVGGKRQMKLGEPAKRMIGKWEGRVRKNERRKNEKIKQQKRTGDGRTRK